MDVHNYKDLFQYPFQKRLEMLNTLKLEIKIKQRDIWYHMKKICSENESQEWFDTLDSAE